MQHTTETTKPVLNRATFPIAVLRLARATDAELAEWDTRLPDAMAEYERQHAGRRAA